MKIDGPKLKVLAFDTIDRFSEVADFLNKNRDYFFTLMKFDILFCFLFLFLAGLSVLLSVSLVGLILLPLIFLFALLLLLIFSYGTSVGLVDLLVSREKPTLNKLLNSIMDNLGFIFQLSVTATVVGSCLGLVFIMLLLSVSVATIFIPTLNLSELISKFVLMPAGIMLNFVFVYMSILYFSGKRGWIELPEQAFNLVTKQKEELFALALGLSILLQSLPFFFNGLIFIFIVYPLLVTPIIQCISILVPYFSYPRKKA